MNVLNLRHKNLLNAFVILCLSALSFNAIGGEAGDYVDDSVITTKIKADLAASEHTSALAIHVETYKGTVQLSGFVDSDKESKTAESIAKKVKGVQEIENDLIVKNN